MARRDVPHLDTIALFEAERVRIWTEVLAFWDVTFLVQLWEHLLLQMHWNNAIVPCGCKT